MPFSHPSTDSSDAKRSWTLGMRRGAAGRCPNCGTGAAFAGYLAVRATCASCGHELGSYRADDAPPYFTIVIVGHIIVGAMLTVDKYVLLPLWVQAAVWLPLTAILTLALLRPVKGAVLGVMWANDTRS
ncbi:MAG: DUF983 domain-containing protein [Proteobacteria bacterium]|nr:DUF983 domain-containing protein [Pseudomonadota bacterium]